MADPLKAVTKVRKVRFVFWPAEAHADIAQYTTHAHLLYT